MKTQLILRENKAECYEWLWRNKKRWPKWFKSLRINEVDKIRKALRGRRRSQKLITANFKIHVQLRLDFLVMQAQISISAHAENSSHVSTNAPFQKIYYGGRAEVLALLTGLKFAT